MRENSSMSMEVVCEGKDCPIRDTCMRYTRPLVEWRTRMQFLSPPYKPLGKTCTEYIKNQKSEQSLR